MKKRLVALSTVGILLGGVVTSGVAFADGVDIVNEDSAAEEESITLTLENVLKRALEDNSNLLILQYQLDILDKQEKGAKDHLDDAEDKLDELKGLGIPGVKGGLYESREALLNQLEKLAPQKNLSNIQIESTKEAVRAYVTSRYVQLLTLKDQLSLNEQSLKWLQDDLKMLKLKNQFGAANQYEIRDLENEMESLSNTIEENQANYEIELLKLLVDLNIPYSEMITLAEIADISLEPVEKPEGIQDLIENSYQMKSAKEILNIAEITLDQNWYSGRYGRQQYQIKVEIAKEEVKQLQKELENKIYSLYDEINSLYRSYQDADREYTYLKESQDRLRLQHEAGLLSSYEYEKFERNLEKTKLQLKLIELNYFMILEQIEALQRGYIS